MPPDAFAALYRETIERRRALAITGFQSYADVGLDGEWVSPYQIASGSPTGPVLLTYNFLDAPTALAHRDTLNRQGYLPNMVFNRVLDLALAETGLTRSDLYVTHAFHLLPQSRSAAIPRPAIDRSFEAVACHELAGRTVIALGEVASSACIRFGIPHRAVPHLSARGFSFKRKATLLADALKASLQGLTPALRSA
jgi:hypothetical protein